ncbi:ataxia telangiectasia mutated family protein [Tanacetum coccineum]
MEKYRERQTDLHLAFIDLEKAYNSVSRELIWKTLSDKETPTRYIKVIQDMYEGARNYVRTPIGNTEYFLVDVGLHQGPSISPYLFSLILDELTKGIQESIPWCLIFADDIVLISEMLEGLNGRLEQNENDRNEEEEIRIGEHILEPKESFRYLGSVIHKYGRIEDDVTHRIQVGWLKWRAATTILCDKKVSLKLKGKFYRVAIRPAMLYGSECWPLTKVQANRMEVAEMRMLRWTCGKTILDMTPNGVFRTNLQVVTIVNKMREGRLRWFGHVKRRPQSAPVRRVKPLTVDGARRRGRPKLRWEDRLKTDLKELLLSEDMTSDRNTPFLPSRSFLPIGFLAFPTLRLFVPLLSFFPFSVSFFPLVGALAVCFSACLLASLLLCRYVPVSMPACMVLGFFSCLLLIYAPVFRSSLVWYVVMHCLLPDVFLKAVPLPPGRGVPVYISLLPYIVSAGLGNVVVV